MNNQSEQLRRELRAKRLSEAQVSVLAQGHNFAVAPKKISTEEIISRIEENGNEIQRQLSDIFHKATSTSDNITRVEPLAVRSLKEHNDIIILPTDKGNTTVVMDEDDYSGKLSAMFGDSRIYTKLKKDPTRIIEGKTADLLKKAGLSADLTQVLILK
ncbi:uncharacterized protein LOC107045675 [Diachasma alloeum]|uniref:uncharacterized protein LOC107045675 n=1 Tax=Diachasma alloeum TaxID=454923 RepID=UPI0007382E71|nr:uncharacterized protein LOC107045675 [Diachasma alloeum]